MITHFFSNCNTLRHLRLFAVVVGNETSLSTCTTADKGLSDYLYMLLMGQAFHGLAGTVLYTIGPTYIDGSVSSKQSPTYLGRS